MKNLPSTRKKAFEVDSEFYFTGKPCKHSHTSVRRTKDGQCLSCQKMRDSSPEYKEKARLASRRYHRENREEVLRKMRERNKRYYAKNSEKIKAATLKYQAENAAKRTKYKKEWAKRKASSDPSFKMYLVSRRMLHRALGVSGQKKYKRTKDYLPYTSEELVAHLEGMFQGGMSWNNYGEWHIDHIKPVKAFIDEGVTDPAIINALENLRPLWADENFSKGAKYEQG
ncbi:MAG: hypothetical protein Tp136SUR676911_1 [Prokaryotic dsDNA virus sp.]|jgi:hypothetical protein|nr:MAG: hypothetical protein Tp136SUR676911_1 [Prokaryotic dsDNA virus sp.]|tara:strand:- start:379 stop:1059 length:681 start_codon:yes stop_codon:yes gene_type:complete